MELVFDNEQNILNTSGEIVGRSPMKLNDIIDLDQVNDMISTGDFHIDFCEDGSVIRVYYNGEAWMTATNKCINASFAYWGSDKSFNEMFYEVFDISNFEKMDKDFTYFFVLVHTENRVVLKNAKNKIIYIYKINNESGEIFKSMENELECSMPMNTNSLVFDSSKRGVILTPKDMTQRMQFKFDYFEYRAWKDVRGNTPTIRERYIQLLEDSQKKTLMYSYYPEYNMMFYIIEGEFGRLIETLYNLYFNTHVYKIARVNFDEAQEGTQLYYLYKTIKNIHYTHKTQKCSVTRELIQSLLYKLPEGVVMKMFNWV